MKINSESLTILPGSRIKVKDKDTDEIYTIELDHSIVLQGCVEQKFDIIGVIIDFDGKVSDFDEIIGDENGKEKD